MRIGILQAGRILGETAERFGDYPEIYARLLTSADETLTFHTYAVLDGVFPDSAEDCDGWLVTGSRHGVYDDLPWIDPLKALLREIRAAKIPLIGICFGHQIMAEAFGGAAGKSSKGWGCGAHEYAFVDPPAWMEETDAAFFSHAMHQDQVTAPPPDASRIATSPFCENAALVYGPREAPDAISVQSHPEFDAEFARALVELRAGTSLPKDVSDAAFRSFGRPVNNAEMARWFVTFLRQAADRRKAA